MNYKDHIAEGWTYNWATIEKKGGTVIHPAIWNTRKAFQQMNPGVKPCKVKICLKIYSE